MSATASRKHGPLALGALAAAALVVGALLYGGLVAPPAQEVDLSFALAPGRFVEHDVVLEEQARMVPFATTSAGGSAPMTARTRLDLRLRLERATGGAVHARFTEVRAASVRIGEQEAIDGSALVGPSAALTLDERGGVTSVRAPESDDPTFRRVLSLVLKEAAFPLGRGSRWSVEERLPRATFRSTVRVTGVDEGVVALSRAREVTATSAPRAVLESARVTGESVAEVRLDGVLRSLHVDEGVQVADAQGALVEDRRTRVTSTLVREGDLERIPVPPANASVVALGPASDPALPVATKEAGRRALERRAEGLTRDGLQGIMARAIRTGAAPDHAKFLWRATAVLRLDDGAVDDLAALFDHEEASPAGQGLVLDLLAAASSEHAQATLVSLLTTPLVDAHPEASRFRQRLALVPSPAPATVAFLADKARADDAWRDPARISLGAAARQLRLRGDAAGADTAVAVLEEEAASLSDQREREVMILALGNTYDPAVLDELASHAVSDVPQTRHAVAEALRGIDDDRARSMLFTLARDVEAPVARRALESLQRQPLEDPPLLTLADDVRSGAVAEHALASVITLAGQRPRSPARDALVEAVLSRRPPGQLQARARGLLR